MIKLAQFNNIINTVIMLFKHQKQEGDSLICNYCRAKLETLTQQQRVKVSYNYNKCYIFQYSELLFVFDYDAYSKEYHLSGDKTKSLLEAISLPDRLEGEWEVPCCMTTKA